MKKLILLILLLPSLCFAGLIQNAHKMAIARMSTGADVTAPEYVSGEIATDGETVTLTFDETITGTENDTFTLDCAVAGDPIALTYASGSGTSSLVFTAGSVLDAASEGESCTLDFDGDADDFKNAADIDLVDFDTQAVTNNSEEGITPTAISKVQTITYNSDASAEVTASYGSGPTEGNLLVAIGFGGNDIGNASISGWTLATSASVGSTSDTGMWYKIAGAAESSDVVLAWSGSSVTTLMISEWTGITTISPLDKVAFANNDGAGLYRSSGTTAETTVAKELIFVGICTGNTTAGQSWSRSFTDEASHDTFSLYIGSKIVNATATYESTMSWTTPNRVAGGMIATFKGD